jgi:hypothetical protein
MLAAEDNDDDRVELTDGVGRFGAQPVMRWSRKLRDRSCTKTRG